MIDTLENTVLPVAEMAAVIGLRPRRLQQLVAAGIVPTPVAGEYDLVRVVQGYLSYLKSAGCQSSPSAAPSRLQDLRAQEIETSNQLRADRVKSAALDAAMTLFDEAAGGLKADLLNIPARVTKDLPLRRRIETGILSALNAGSARCSAQAKEHADADRTR